jgi:hypothetical protein
VPDIHDQHGEPGMGGIARVVVVHAQRVTRRTGYKTRSSKFSTKPRGLTLYGLVCVRFGRVH